MAENFGSSFSIDISQLKKGLAEANSLIRRSESEFKAAAAGMDDWTESQEGLEARIKYLTEAVDIQQEKVNALTKEYQKQIDEGLNPASKAAIDMETAINREKTALNKNKTELDKQTKALEELSTETSDADKQLDKLEDATVEVGDGFTVAKGAIADFISDGLQNLIGFAKDGITSLLNLSDETKELRTNMAKLETSFEDAGFTTEDAMETYKEFYGILGDEGQATEAVAHLSALAKSEEDLAKWTDIATGVYAKFGASLPIENLTEAANETAKTGQLTGGLADSLNWIGIEEEKFQEKLDACTTEQERQQLITETLQGAYGGLAESYRENNEEVINANKAQADYADTQAKLGEKIQPVTQAIKEGVNELITAFLELIEDVDFEALSQHIEDAFTWFIDDGIPMLKEGVAWLKDNIPLLTTVAGGLTAAMIGNKIAAVAATAAANGMTIAQYALTRAQTALNAAMKANVIGLIITAITALVAAIMYLWKNNEDFRNFWIATWENIKQISHDVWVAITGFFTGAWEIIKTTWSVVSGWFSDIWDKVKNAFASAPEYFSTKFSEAWSNVKKAFSSVGSFFGGIWDTIKQKFTTVGTMVGDAIGTAFKFAVNAVIATVEGAINNIPNAINGAIGLINELPGVSIGYMPTISLPRLAKGGIVNRATTALIGEQGKEAIVPLERNTEWIDKVADRVSEKMGSVATVNVTNNNHFAKAHTEYELYKTGKQTEKSIKRVLREAHA